MQFHDPRPPVIASAGCYALRLTAAAPRIGLLANGFPDSVAFLTAMQPALVAALPGATFMLVAKPSPPTPLTADQLQTLTQGCDAVIGAYGH